MDLGLYILEKVKEVRRAANTKCPTEIQVTWYMFFLVFSLYPKESIWIEK